MRTTVCSCAAIVLLLAVSLGAQQKPSGDQQPQQNIPDAPSAVRPPQTFPSNPTPTPAPPKPAEQPAVNPDTGNPIPPPPPGPKITQAPAGTVPRDTDPREQLFTLTKSVNFVVVPVTVKNTDGNLVDGLLSKDFRVYEDGAEQKLTFFTSDPFPLSAAVVVDTGMSDKDLKKVQQTLPALVGAFGQYDEVAVFAYGDSVQEMQSFSATGSERLTLTMHRLKERTGQMGGVPVTSGPLANNGPIINGRPWDGNARPMPVYKPESRVLNDAILAAANELAHLPANRRKIIFVISDGREYNSDASYTEVLHVLLERQIAVYAVGVGSSAVPIYSQAQKINVPGTGSGDILPKYVNATGGEMLAEFSQASIERAYSALTEQARNQYTLGYATKATMSSSYRTIEVVVDRPSLRVHAKQGYYPLPPAAR